MGGVFVGSRTIATQEDLGKAEARSAIERARDKEAAAIAYATVGDRIERIWEELSKREATAFRQKDAEQLKELLRSEIRGHKHED